MQHVQCWQSNRGHARAIASVGSAGQTEQEDPHASSKRALSCSQLGKPWPLTISSNWQRRQLVEPGHRYNVNGNLHTASICARSPCPCHHVICLRTGQWCGPLGPRIALNASLWLRSYHREVGPELSCAFRLSGHRLILPPTMWTASWTTSEIYHLDLDLVKCSELSHNPVAIANEQSNSNTKTKYEPNILTKLDDRTITATSRSQSFHNANFAWLAAVLFILLLFSLPALFPLIPSRRHWHQGPLFPNARHERTAHGYMILLGVLSNEFQLDNLF